MSRIQRRSLVTVKTAHTIIFLVLTAPRLACVWWFLWRQTTERSETHSICDVSHWFQGSQSWRDRSCPPAFSECLAGWLPDNSSREGFRSLGDYGALVPSSLLLPAGHGLGGFILPDAAFQVMLPTTGPKQMDPVAPGLFSRKLRQNDCLRHFFF